MNAAELEPRLAAAVVTVSGGAAAVLGGPSFPVLAGYPGPASVDTDGEYVVVTPRAGGGPNVEVYTADGEPVSRFFSFDPAYRGGQQIALAGGRIWVTPEPGGGGGPVLREFDLGGTLLSSVYVGDPESRNGLYLGAGDSPQEVTGVPAPGSTGIPLPLSRLGVGYVGDGEPTAEQWGWVSDALALIPPGLLSDFLAAGGQIDTTLGPLSAVTAGTFTTPDPAGGLDGWRALVRFTDRAFTIETILHEVAGHGADRLLGYVSRSSGWLQRWPGGAYPSAYYANDPAEAFAYAGSSRLLGLSPPSPEIDQFLDTIYSDNGW